MANMAPPDQYHKEDDQDLIDELLDDTQEEDEEPDEDKPSLGDRIDDAQDIYDRIKEERDKLEERRSRARQEAPEEKPSVTEPEVGEVPPSEVKPIEGNVTFRKPPVKPGAGAAQAGTEAVGEAATAGEAAVEGGAAAVEGAAEVTATGVEVGVAAWWVIVIVVIVFIIIAIVLFGIGFIIGMQMGKINSASTATVSYALNGQAEGILLYPTGCSEEVMAQTINDFIEAGKAGTSPLSGQGQLFVNAGKQYGLNPFFIAAQSRMESQFATTGYAKSHPESHNPSGHKYGTLTSPFGTPGPISPEGDRYIIYPDYQTFFMAHGNLINHYISEHGLNTLLKIASRYMTGNPQSYASTIGKWIEQLQTTAGCSIATTGSVAGAPATPTSITDLITNAGFQLTDVAIATKGPTTIQHNADTSFASASSIKSAILLAYLTKYGVPDEDSSDDKALTQMIRDSNNSQANAVVSRIGGRDVVNSTLSSLGISGVELNRSFGASSSTDNMMTANGAIQVLEAINNLSTPDNKRSYALGLLGIGDTGSGQDYIRNALSGQNVMSKSGQGLNEGARNDIAIVTNGENTYYIAILVKTSNSTTGKAQQLIGDIAKVVTSSGSGTSPSGTIRCSEETSTETSS